MQVLRTFFGKTDRGKCTNCSISNTCQELQIPIKVAKKGYVFSWSLSARVSLGERNAWLTIVGLILACRYQAKRFKKYFRNFVFIKFQPMNYVEKLTCYTVDIPWVTHVWHTLSDTFSLSDTHFQRKWKFSRFQPFLLVNYERFPICFFEKSLNSCIGFICT